MDYSLLSKNLESYLSDQESIVNGVQKQIAAIDAGDAFEQRLLTVFTHTLSCFEINEALKKIIATILEEGDFFSDQAIHKTTKIKFLEKILKDNNYVENSRQFNLSTIQTYVANIIHKQLYEINIKIEENQRSLNKIEAASFKRRETFSQDNEDVQKEVPRKDQNEPPPPLMTQSQYLLVEIENSQFAIKYSEIMEILKFDKAVSEKVLSARTVPHHKLLSFNRRNVLKQLKDKKIDKKQILINHNAGLTNKEDKHFAVVTQKGNEYIILFVDYIEYTEPVDAKDMGEYARTVDGDYKVMLM